jgi:hypothetical protein
MLFILLFLTVIQSVSFPLALIPLPFVTLIITNPTTRKVNFLL